MAMAGAAFAPYRGERSAMKHYPTTADRDTMPGPMRRSPREPVGAVIPEPGPNRTDAFTWVLVGLVLVPILVEIIRVLTQFHGFHATGDNALNELAVRDLGRYAILLGPFSRSGWSHPGPLFYYLIWIPYRLFGSNSAAMLAGALLINAAALGIAIVVAQRWAGRALAVPVAVVCGLIVVHLPDGYLSSPWNPSVTALPFGAFLVVAWAATCGDRWALPAAVFIGTFCVQTHIGYAPLVIPVMLWCVWRALRDRRTPLGASLGPRGLTALWWAIVVLALVWAPVVIEQLTRDPGNIRVIARYFRDSTDPIHSIRDGYRIIAAQFTINADWIVGRNPISIFNTEPDAMFASPVPVLLVPFMIALVWVAWRGTRVLQRLAAVLLIPLAFGVDALARTLGLMYDYRLRWVWALAALCMAFTVATFINWVRPRVNPRVVMATLTGAMALIIVLGTVGVAKATNADPVDLVRTRETTELSRQAVRNVPAGRGIVLLRATSFSTLTIVPGLTLMFERANIPVKIDEDADSRLALGRHRMYHGGPVRALLFVAEDGDIARIRATPGARQIAFVSDVSPPVRARAEREYAAMSERQRHEVSARLVLVLRRLHAIAIYSVPSQ